MNVLETSPRCWEDRDDQVAVLVQVRKVQKAQEREERIRDQDATNEFSARNVEDDKLMRILRSRGLLLFEVVFSAVKSLFLTYLLLHMLRCLFLSVHHCCHSSLPHSFTADSKPTCLTNPTHHGLSSSLRTALMTRTWTGSSVIISFCF